MLAINPYLNFNGNALEAFNFYKSVFGGEFAMLQKLKDTPEANKYPAAEGEKIMHVALPLGTNILMGSDTFSSMGHPEYKAGNNFSLSLSAQSREEADRIFHALSAGGTVVMPLQETFWGSYFGMCTDKFGISWMLDSDKK